MNNVLNDDQRRLVEENMEFAAGLALTLLHCGVSIEDLKQESYLGLCEAALRYKDDKETEFRTFAYFWCRKMMFLAIASYGRPMSLSREDRQEARFVTIEENPSLYSHMARLADEGDEQDELTANSKEETRCEQLLSALSPQEHTVIKMLFGLDDTKMTKKQVAAVLDIKPDSLTEIYRRAINKMLINNL